MAESKERDTGPGKGDGEALAEARVVEQLWGACEQALEALELGRAIVEKIKVGNDETDKLAKSVFPAARDRLRTALGEAIGGWGCVYCGAAPPSSPPPSRCPNCGESDDADHTLWVPDPPTTAERSEAANPDSMSHD